MGDEQANENEGASPEKDLRDQNPGKITTGDLTDKVDDDDPHKVEKLTKAGRDNMDHPGEGGD